MGSSATANNGSLSGGARPASLRSSSDDTTNTIGSAGLGRSHLRLPQGAIGYADPQ